MHRLPGNSSFILTALVMFLQVHTAAAITEVTTRTLQEQIDMAEVVVLGRVRRIIVHTYTTETEDNALRSCGKTYSIETIDVYKGHIAPQFNFSTPSTPIGSFFRPVMVGDELLLLLEVETTADSSAQEVGQANSDLIFQDLQACETTFSKRRPAFDTEGAFLIQTEPAQGDKKARKWFHYQSNKTILPCEVSTTSRVSRELAPEAQGQLSTLRQVLWSRVEPLVRTFGTTTNRDSMRRPRRDAGYTLVSHAAP